MRNLYRAIGGDPQTDAHTLQEKISKVENPDVRADCDAVLGNARRRKVYDAVWTAMTDIGTLRSSLGRHHGSYFPSAFLMSAPQMRGIDDFIDSGRFHEKRHRPIKKQGKGRIILKIFKYGLATIGLMFLLLPILLELLGKNVGRAPAPTAATAPSPARQVAPDFPPQAFPESGRINTYLPGMAGKLNAPFEIKTFAGSNYLLKMEDWGTGEDMFTVFVRGGETIEVKVPVGKYRVKYASGQTWYGHSELFGPGTSYSKANSPFEFRKTPDGYSGYTITLYKVRHGNLRTSDIRASDF